jgi:Protein of unknown function (DUF2809)
MYSRLSRTVDFDQLVKSMKPSQPIPSPKLWRFSRDAFLVFLVVLLIEIVIATFFHDRFVRFFLGDVLIVVLICYLIRSFCTVKLSLVIASTLIFAYLIEIAQYFNIASYLGGYNSLAVQLTVGTTFDWKDLIAYTIGSGLNVAIGHYHRQLAAQ